jgi:hypothetical protein
MFTPKRQQFQLSPRVPLATIDETVSARLGTTRVPGNAQPAAFNRQVAMYLAKHVGCWSTTRIGKFYNGRHHSTVCYALKRIEALRKAHPDIDGLLTNLTDEIRSAPIRPSSYQKPTARKPRLGEFAGPFDDDFLDALAERIVERLCARTLQGGTGVALNENATISIPTLECHNPHF